MAKTVSEGGGGAPKKVRAMVRPGSSRPGSSKKKKGQRVVRTVSRAGGSY